MNSLRKRKRSQRIESESDSDDIPLSVLKKKVATTPMNMTGTVETDPVPNGPEKPIVKQKPKKHKTKSSTKWNKIKRQFTTKPPPSQSAKPTVK